MKEIYIYLLENWTWLLPIFISVVESIFIIILKKRPSYNLLAEKWNEVYSLLPYWIIDAEKKYDTGAQKIAYVFQEAVKDFPSLFCDDAAIRDLRRVIELILECPQKKGGN